LNKQDCCDDSGGKWRTKEAKERNESKGDEFVQPKEQFQESKMIQSLMPVDHFFWFY